MKDYLVQRLDGDTKNTSNLVEKKNTWEDVGTLVGWLDLIAGDATTSQNSLIAQSSHVLISTSLEVKVVEGDRIVTPKANYEITFVDDVMELGDHYEIYCKVVG